MPTCLLHLRSAISLVHIEGDLDEFEQRFLPDDHYVLSRQGRSVNYLVNVDGSLEKFHGSLVGYGHALRLHELSLVELGMSFAVSEQGCSDTPAEDACGEWRLEQDEESFAWEEVRCRTGAAGWMRKHGLGKQRQPNHPIGMLLYFHHPIQTDSRWISNLRSALGKTSRSHWHDERSILITAGAQDDEVSHLLQSKRFARHFDPKVVHTALCFALTGTERHMHGAIQSVQPPAHVVRRPKTTATARPSPSFQVVRSKPSNPRAVELAAAIERLKRSSRPRR